MLIYSLFSNKETGHVGVKVMCPHTLDHIVKFKFNQMVNINYLHNIILLNNSLPHSVVLSALTETE